MDPSTITGNVIATVIGGIILAMVFAAVGPIRRSPMRLLRSTGHFFCWLWTFRPITRRRHLALVLREAGRHDDQVRDLRDEQARELAADRLSHESDVDSLTAALQRAQESTREAETKQLRAEDALSRLVVEHTRAFRDAEQDHQDTAMRSNREGFDSGLRLGRELERYGEDWTNLSQAGRSQRKAAYERRRAQMTALQRSGAVGRKGADEQRVGYSDAGHRQAASTVEVAGSGLFPRWGLEPPRDGMNWTLINHLTGSHAHSVRLESDELSFIIKDEAYWPEFRGPMSVPFVAELTEWGRNHGAKVEVHWIDDDGRKRLKIISIAPSRRGARPLVG